MKTRMFLVLSTLIAALICFTGTAIAEEGITDTEIHIGSFGPQTGPAAAWGGGSPRIGYSFQDDQR